MLKSEHLNGRTHAQQLAKWEGGSIDSLWEIYGAISITNYTTDVIKLVLRHLDVSLLPKHRHTSEAQGCVERAFTCIYILQKLAAICSLDTTGRGTRETVVAFLMDNIDADGFCLWVDLFIRLGLSLPVQRAPSPTPDTTCTHFAYLFTDFFELSPRFPDVFVASPAFSDLLLRMWMARDNHGQIYMEFQKGSGPGCTVALLMSVFTAKEENRVLLLQRLANFPSEATAAFARAAMERARHCQDAIQQGFPPQSVFDIIAAVTQIIARLAGLSDSIRRRFYEVNYLLELSSILFSIHDFLLDSSAHRRSLPGMCRPVSYLFKTALSVEGRVVKNIRDLVSVKFVLLCISVSASATHASSAEAEDIHSFLHLLCMLLPHPSIIEKQLSHTPADLHTLPQPNFEGCPHMWLPEIHESFCTWLKTLNVVYSAHAGSAVAICDNPLVSRTPFSFLPAIAYSLSVRQEPKHRL